MHLAQKLLLLDQLYRLYDQYITSIDTACRLACSDCCTCNVTVTTLEARRMIDELPAGHRARLKELIGARMNAPRFIPQATVNQIADLCVSGNEPPEEVINPSWGSCPLLTDRICTIYNARSFGCRCLVSAIPCAQTGAAEMSEFTTTVNTLFLQVIEHIDQDGFSGNLSDVLTYILTPETRFIQSNPPHLISNSPLMTLLIPPEHQEKIKPILNQIRALPI
jgi:hypothetical protein